MNISFNPAGPMASFVAKSAATDATQADTAAKTSPTASIVTATRPTAAKAIATDSGGSSESPTVQALRKQIEQLQKQLAQQEQQLRAAMAGGRDKDPANEQRIAALQSAVSTTMGQLSAAAARLAAALMAEGGSSSGSLVSATA